MPLILATWSALAIHGAPRLAIGVVQLDHRLHQEEPATSCLPSVALADSGGRGKGTGKSARAQFTERPARGLADFYVFRPARLLRTALWLAVISIGDQVSFIRAVDSETHRCLKGAV